MQLLIRRGRFQFMIRQEWIKFLSDKESLNLLTNLPQSPTFTHPAANTKQFALFDLSDWGMLSVTGQNAANFLQGQATCDIRKISVQQGQLGGFCDYKGRLFAIFYAFLWQQNYYLWMPKEIIPETIKQLNKYALLSKIILQDESENRLTLGLSINTVDDNIKNIFHHLPDQLYASHVENEVFMLRIPGSLPSFMLTGDIENLKQTWEKLKSHSHFTSDNGWNLEQIRAGLPFIYIPTIGQYMPHQLNLPDNHGVSFDKGCYTGQEIVARLHYRGKLKQHLNRATVNTTQSPHINDYLYTASADNQENKKVVGQVVMSAQADENQFEMLVIVEDGAREQDIYLHDVNGPKIILL
jgi:tRNA-modifying protein YgfZ